MVLVILMIFDDFFIECVSLAVDHNKVAKNGRKWLKIALKVQGSKEVIVILNICSKSGFWLI